MHLYLQDNLLTVIDGETFAYANQLYILDLQRNKIKYIAEEAFEFNRVRPNIYLYDNNIKTCTWLQHISESASVSFTPPNFPKEYCLLNSTCKGENIYQHITYKNQSCSACECQKAKLNCTIECEGGPYEIRFNTNGTEECSCIHKLQVKGISCNYKITLIIHIYTHVYIQNFTWTFFFSFSFSMCRSCKRKNV